MDNEVAHRIKETIKALGLSANSFSIKAGIAPSNLSKMLKGAQNITQNTLNKIIAAFPELNRDWLLTGHGERLHEVIDPTKVISDTVGSPFYDADFTLGYDEFLKVPNRRPECLINMPGYEKATLWCRASGHSMEPEINDKEIIALRRIEDFSFLPYGEIYAICTSNGLHTIKRIGRSDKSGHFRLIPTNKEYDEQDIPIRMITCVYQVLGAMKSFL